MIFRIPSLLAVFAVILTNAFTHPAQAESQAEITFRQSIEDSEEPRDFEDYLQQFPNGQFETLAQRRLARAKIAARGRALQNEHSEEAMHVAASNNAVDVMQWLRAQGADINARNNVGFTPMHAAAYNDSVNAMQWLRAHGADINARANDGGTPMHYATFGDSVNAMQWLRAQGADINARDNDGSTPMHYAMLNNSVNAINWLRANGGHE